MAHFKPKFRPRDISKPDVWLRNVSVLKCPGFEMSGFRNVWFRNDLVLKCLGFQIARFRNFEEPEFHARFSTVSKCLGFEMSGFELTGFEMSGFEMSGIEMSGFEMSGFRNVRRLVCAFKVQIVSETL